MTTGHQILSVLSEKQGRIHGNSVADGRAGAVMGIQKWNSKMLDRLTNLPTDMARCRVACPRPKMLYVVLDRKNLHLRSSSPDQRNFLIKLFRIAVLRVVRRHAYIFKSNTITINIKLLPVVSSCGNATLYEALSVRQSVSTS